MLEGALAGVVEVVGGKVMSPVARSSIVVILVPALVG